MYRAYHQWFSNGLQRNMELLTFGQAGTKVLFFPPRMGRFYDYENWGVIAALQPKIDRGELQVFCVDSLDSESYYCYCKDARAKINAYLAYEKYILEEVVPFIHRYNSNTQFIVAGCSLGAYHAVNLALKHPDLFTKVVGMSGRYDLTWNKAYFIDLLGGYYDNDVYFNMPTHYMANIQDPVYLQQIKKLEIHLAVGKEDLFLENNYLLKDLLQNKGVFCNFYEWEGEAHKAKYWKQMVQWYF